MSQRSPQQAPTRRDFLDRTIQAVLAAVGAIFVYPVARFLKPPPETQVTGASVTLSADELPLNAAKIVKLGSRPALVLRTPTGEIRAFDARCTHLACTVGYEPAQSKIVCNCHGGCFDLEGRNVSGPPPRPLDPLQVTLKRRAGGDGHDVIVSA